MAYTQADLELIKAAILKLATGTRTVEVKIRNKTIRYGEVDLQKLRDLESSMSQGLKPPRFFRCAMTNRGIS